MRNKTYQYHLLLFEQWTRLYVKAARLWLLWPSSVHQRACPESNRSKRGIVLSLLFSGLCSPFITFSVCSEAGQGSRRSVVLRSFSNTSFGLGHWVKNHVKKLWDSSSVSCSWKLVAAWNLFGTSLASAQEVQRQTTCAKPFTASSPGTSLVEVPPMYQNMDPSSHPSPGSVFTRCSGPV